MLRFVPDTWLEVVLRPVLLVDSVAGLYSEIHAPDVRFVLLIAFLGLAALARRSLRLLDGAQARTLLGLTIAVYVWTVISGNARYFLWGLVVVGPLVVVAARLLPGTQSLRNSAILGAVALQASLVWMTYEPNVWALRPWAQGPGLALERTVLVEKPAVFITVGAISHSVLVPKMHPLSRWTNVGGQQDLEPGTRDFERQQALLNSPMPKYGVIRATQLVMDDSRQPTEAAWLVIRRVMQRQGLVPSPRACTFARATLADLPFKLSTRQPHESGFWFCEFERAAPSEAIDRATMQPLAPELEGVFNQVERRCPRYFPPGNAVTRLSDEGFVRHYSHSDTTLVIHHAGVVYFKNMRALNPTEVARTEDVRAGRFQLDCDRLPGRYVPPWARGWGIDLE